jgi:hypothetical protein
MRETLRLLSGKFDYHILFASGANAKLISHFLSWQVEQNDGYISGIKEDIFLVVDSLSVSSYAMQPISGDIKLAGDFGGFVIAVEVEFDPNNPGDHAEESPGFTGRMGILGSLIWSDLYALAMAQTAYPEDLWPLAMNHPWKVYVGPTVPVQRELWKDAVQMHGEAVRQVAGLVKQQGQERRQEALVFA